jgi:hypothetical protein
MKFIALIIFLPLGAFAAMKGYRHWRAPATGYLGKLGICIIAAGLVGFAEPFWVQLPRTFHSYPSKVKLPAIAFNWTAVALPLWHPFAAMLVIAFGYLLFKASSSDEWWDAPGARGARNTENSAEFYPPKNGPHY